MANKVPRYISSAMKEQLAGNLQRAEDYCRKAIRADRCSADSWCLLGTILMGRGRIVEAVDCTREALRLRPNYAEAFSNLGVLLRMLGDMPGAEYCYRRAVAIAPYHSNPHMNLGNLLRLRGQLDEAVACYSEAVRLNPSSPQSQMNLGASLRALGRFDEAEACLREAVRLDPRFAPSYINLANALRDLGRYDEARAYYQEAVARGGNDAEIRYNMGYLYLLKGNYEEGWPLYEARWECREFTPYPDLASPRWDGSPLDARTILLFAEQGLGDTLQFIRYSRLVKERGGEVVFWCPKALSRILARCPGVDRVVQLGDDGVPRGAEAPPHEVNAALMSLPGIFETTLTTIPAEVPYLFAKEERVEAWRRELAEEGVFNVAIVWQGNPKNPADRTRSIPLGQFAPLAEVPGVRLLSIQKYSGAEAIRAVAGRFPLIDLGPRLDDSFEETAAIMRAVDLVVAADTAAIHLAGALGVDAWMPLSVRPEWRWPEGREDSPWYPTLRIFRQSVAGHWDIVFGRIAAALAARCANHGMLISSP